MNLDVSYSISRRLEGTSLQHARERIIRALQAEGFGVLTEIDVKTTLHKKLGVDVAPYVILGACNPGLAHRALTAEPAIGLLLPCNVVVAEDGGDALIAAASPRSMFSVVEGAGELAGIAEEAEARLRRAVEGA